MGNEIGVDVSGTVARVCMISPCRDSVHTPPSECSLLSRGGRASAHTHTHFLHVSRSFKSTGDAYSANKRWLNGTRSASPTGRRGVVVRPLPTASSNVVSSCARTGTDRLNHVSTYSQGGRHSKDDSCCTYASNSYPHGFKHTQINTTPYMYTPKHTPKRSLESVENTHTRTSKNFEAPAHPTTDDTHTCTYGDTYTHTDADSHILTNTDTHTHTKHLRDKVHSVCVEEAHIVEFLEKTSNYIPIPPLVMHLNSHPKSGRVYCCLLPTEDIQEIIDIAQTYLDDKILAITGSGSSLIRKIFENLPHKRNTTLQYHRELPCVLDGFDYFLQKMTNACFYYQSTHRALTVVSPDPNSFVEMGLGKDDIDDFYPYLLVNIKTGISFHKVTRPGRSERVGGSTIGGATFMGLMNLLCNRQVNPEEAFEMALRGDNGKVDMLVRDIYGGDYRAIALSGETIASSFGKMQHVDPTHWRVTKNTNCECEAYSDEGEFDDAPQTTEIPTDADIAKSLQTIWFFNLTQLAYMHSVVYLCKRIVFVGYFLDMPGHLASVQHCIDFWSKGVIKVVFVRGSPFLGAFGALLCARQRSSSVHL